VVRRLALALAAAAPRTGRNPALPPHAARRSGTDNPMLGIVLVIAAMAVFSGMDGISKHLVADYDAFFIAWVRYIIQTLTLVPVMLLLAHRQRRRLLPVVRHPWLQALRGLCMLGSAVFFIMGLRTLPMAEATTIGFASPLMLIVLSIVLLGERVEGPRWVAVLVGFAGVMVVVRPGSGAIGFDAVYPLLSAVCWALALIGSRRIGSDDPPTVTLLMTILSGLVATSFTAPLVWQVPTWSGLAIMATAGLMSTLGQYLLIRGFMVAPASLLAPFQYSQMLTSVLIGWLVFDNLPDGWTWLGATIIVASGLYAWWYERRNGRS